MTVYPATLRAHLLRDVTTTCQAWRLTRRDGQVSGYTDHDEALTVDGTLCEPKSGFSASEAVQALGLAVDTVDVEGVLSSAGLADADIEAGLLDDATVETFLVNWRSPADAALVRRATIGKITRSDGRFVAELKSRMHALDQPNARTLTRTCDAELGDARCGIDLEQPAFKGSGSIAERIVPNTYTMSGLGTFAAGWFAHGTLTWTSGARNGRADRIAEHRKPEGSVVLTLAPASGSAPEAGDGFVARAGCDKSFATCKAKFSNSVNFRGFPHLPGNDAAYGYVTDGMMFDGGPLVP